MKIETKLPFFPVYAKDILWETRDYDIATFGVFWKMLLLTWVRECRWIKDDENIPGVLKITPKQWQRARKMLKYSYLVKGEWIFRSLQADKEHAIKRSNSSRKAANFRWGNQP
jgi:uncharacterized protein YdaU (DUF1376 family)